MLEYVVHLDAGRPPRDIMLAKADVPEDVSRMQITTDDLPAGWRSYSPPEALAAIGDAFACELRTAMLLFPSAGGNGQQLDSQSYPPDFHKIKFHLAAPFDYDPRLLKVGR